MNFQEMLQSRRSVRKYLSRPVPGEAIGLMKQAAKYAPTARNGQEFKLYFITNRKMIERIGEQCAHQEHIGQAPLLVVAVSAPEQNYSVPFVIENVALSAHASGLGSCIVGWLEHEPLKEILGLEAGLDVSVLLTVGYADGEAELRERKPDGELFVDII